MWVSGIYIWAMDIWHVCIYMHMGVCMYIRTFYLFLLVPAGLCDIEIIRLYCVNYKWNYVLCTVLIMNEIYLLIHIFMLRLGICISLIERLPYISYHWYKGRVWASVLVWCTINLWRVTMNVKRCTKCWPRLESNGRRREAAGIDACLLALFVWHLLYSQQTLRLSILYSLRSLLSYFALLQCAYVRNYKHQ